MPTCRHHLVFRVASHPAAFSWPSHIRKVYLFQQSDRNLQLPANTTRWRNAGMMFAQRRRRWANISPALLQHVVRVVSGTATVSDPSILAVSTRGQVNAERQTNCDSMLGLCRRCSSSIESQLEEMREKESPGGHQRQSSVWYATHYSGAHLLWLLIILRTD